MAVLFEIDPARPEAAEARTAIQAAAEAIHRGRLVVFPTDTVYGIATRPDDPASTSRLFDGKRRPPGLNVPVLAPDAASAWQLVVTTREAGLLADAFWPGALTMVLPRTDRSMPWSLGDHAGTLGVRVPADPVSGALLRAAGPVAATSANLSGRPPLERGEELMQTFGDAVAVYLVAPGEIRGSGSPSTVVDLTGPTPSILRRGQIDPERILSALR